MRRITTFLFYLLILLLPTQLGRHFFPPFSLIAGIRSDYLAPTIYLTDVIIGLMIGVFFTDKVLNLKHQITNKFQATTTKSQTNSKQQPPNHKQENIFDYFKIRILNLFGIWDLRFGIFLLVIFYLLFTSIFIATNKWAAIYKLVKIIEFIFLGFIIHRLKPKLPIVLTVLAFDVVYTTLIGIGQFVLQRSLGGIFWHLGERTFYAGTPGIAVTSLAGRLLLRPYSTFSHPNVFGGFLAVVLPLLLFVLYRRISAHRAILILFWVSFFLGLLGLIISGSRAAWIVAAVGFLLSYWRKGKGIALFAKKYKNFLAVGLNTLIVSSVIIPFTLSSLPLLKDWRSWNERTDLIKTAMISVQKQPFFGVGLNNFIVQSHEAIKGISGLYIFQPVHNIYLLVLAETGLIGLGIILFALGVIYYRSLLANPMIALALAQLFLLGCFDHYLFTLQQGQLLFTLFASFSFLADNKEDDF